MRTLILIGLLLAGCGHYIPPGYECAHDPAFQTTDDPACIESTLAQWHECKEEAKKIGKHHRIVSFEGNDTDGYLVVYCEDGREP